MSRTSSCLILAVSIGIAVAAPATKAAPRLPTDDHEVLQRLPNVVDASARAALHAQWQRTGTAAHADASAIAQTLTLAEHYVALGRTEGDPRYYGIAEGLLTGPLGQTTPPIRALVLAAVIHQARHEFSTALALLEHVLARRPTDAQAWLTRATIERVRGDYAAARASCARLVGLVEPLTAATCMAQVGALDGHAAASLEFLEQILTVTPSAEVAVRQWAQTTLGELAAASNRPELGDTYFRAALGLADSTLYLRLAYADYLLEMARPDEVFDLLAADEDQDGALLRLALAARATGDTRFERFRAELRARLGAAETRGETLHDGEAARFALEIEQQPREALRLALSNWQRQREPRDARIVLAAAQAAAKPEAARPVVEFLRARRTEDAVLARLISSFPDE